MNGKDQHLRASTIKRLHQPLSDSDASPGYAFGWGIDEGNGRVVHWHNGSGGTFFAEVRIYPEDNCATVVLMNTGSGDGLAPLIGKSIMEHYVN